MGRLVTRVTTDVDALNEMFTAGVVSIFEDVFVLDLHPRDHAGHELEARALTFTVFLMIYATKIFRDKVRDSYRRIRTAIARINSFLQEAVSGMLVLQLFNREERAYKQFSDINASHMEADKDAILAYSVYYPVEKFCRRSRSPASSGSEAAGSFTMRPHQAWRSAFHGSSLVTARVVRSVMSLGVLVAFMQYAQRFFRPDPGSQRKVQHSAVRDGSRRTCLQIAGHEDRGDFPGRYEEGGRRLH